MMLEQVQQGREIWCDTNDVINKWLMERQELISQFCALTTSTEQYLFNQRIDRFCEVLMDYLSAGHFEVFTELEQEARTFDERGLQLVNALYPYLSQSTELALSFNDHCEQLKNSQLSAEEIRQELSQLGEALTDRFELEDQLVEYVHKSNAIAMG